MKKFLLSLLSMTPILGISAFAAPVTLNLFGGGLSLLDSLLFIGIGLVVLGVLLICIAFLKPVSKKAKKEDEVVVPHFLDNPDWDAEILPEEEMELTEQEEYPKEDVDEPTQEEIAENSQAEELPEDIPEVEENPAEDTPEVEENPPEEIIEDEPEEIPEEPEMIEPVEEKIYPKLILTNRETNDFMIIPLSGENTIGRKPENDLVLNDTTVSGRHCVILTEEEKVFIQDENSTNGTFLNGNRLFEKTELHPGDRITLGKQEFNISFHA